MQQSPSLTESSITLGLWPIAGITTVGVTPVDAFQTIATALELGIMRFDTAFSYGYDGESDRLLGQFIKGRRDQLHITGKVGQRWTVDRQRIVDGSPQTLIRDAETSLSRIGIESFDVLVLHSPDPDVAIERSAEAMVTLRERGLCQQIGISNITTGQLKQFIAAAPCQHIQCPLNLLQRQSLESLIPVAANDDCQVAVFWTLMKGLLAGKISRDFQFPAGDSRPNYEIFQGDMRRRAHDVLDRMKLIAAETSTTIPSLSIGWALAQPGVTTALVGARRPDQVHDIAGATCLPSDVVQSINNIVAEVDGV